MTVEEMIDKSCSNMNIKNNKKRKRKRKIISDSPITDLFDGTYRVYSQSRTSLSGLICDIYICRHCEYCLEPYFQTKANDKLSAKLSMKRRGIKNVSAFCSKDCAYKAGDSTSVQKKSWDRYKDILKIKESINDDTEEIFINNKSYKRKNIPEGYIKHFKSRNKTLAFKRWIDKQCYHTKFGEKSLALAKEKQRKADKKLENQTQRIEYWSSIEGQNEKRLRKEKATQKRRIADMKRYNENPVKFSLKRLLLHCVEASINGKPYEASNDIIDYKKCTDSLKNGAKRIGMTVKKIKALGYHIDHIIPVSCYNELDCNELIKCFSYNNLRWLPAKENISRKNKLRPEDIEVIKTLPLEIYPKSWGGVIPV
tara:strand:- start:297 stop:1400 length:1104 start_codon:yes stop_codon:yes gene_type:complete